ncbi:MAG: hypothetical protein VCD66_10175 [Alphaproteobacteria bacterium]|jgi:hypothetical protein
MPIGKMHQQRKGRNLTLAGILVLLMMALFVLTMFNMQGQTWSPN